MMKQDSFSVSLVSSLSEECVMGMPSRCLNVNGKPCSNLLHIEWSPFLNSGFSSGSDDKESACNAGILGSIPASGRSPGEGNGHPTPIFLLGEYQDRGAWRAALQGVTKSCAWLSTQHTLLNSQLKFHPLHEIITNLFELYNLFFLQYCVHILVLTLYLVCNDFYNLA